MPNLLENDWQDWIGRSEQRTDMVTSGLVERLCATIDCPVPEGFTPQGIHWCLCLPDTPTAQLGEDGHPRRDVPGAFLPPIPLPRRMWASSRLAFHTPIAVGAAIERVSTITAISEKAGSSGRLAFVTVTHETLSDGALAVHEEQMLVYRGASGSAMATTPAPPEKAERAEAVWPHVRNVTPNEAMLMRYSGITNNAHRIHYDLPYAKEQEGYAALVVHGPLTATLLLEFAARIIGHNRLKTFAFRGVAPLFCGEEMTLVAKVDGGEMTLAALSPNGAAAMTARAEIGM